MLDKKPFIKRSTPSAARAGAEAALCRYRLAIKAFDRAKNDGEIDCAVYEMAAARREYARLAASVRAQGRSVQNKLPMV